MTCQHRQYDICELGLYGGRPSDGVCGQCLATGGPPDMSVAEIAERKSESARLVEAAARKSAQRDTCIRCQEWRKANVGGCGKYLCEQDGMAGAPEADRVFDFCVMHQHGECPLSKFPGQE